ncbi:MAG: hypothetical protein ACYDCL_15865 [Myxococcales bacterium]
MKRLLPWIAVTLFWLAPAKPAQAQVVVVRPWGYHPYIYHPWIAPVAPVVPVYRPYAYYHPYVYHPWVYRPVYRRW